jgi:hypothetical protein
MQPSTPPLLENAHGALWLHEGARGGIVHHELRGVVSSECYRALLSRGLDVFREQHLTKWLSDDSQLEAIRDEDLRWGFESFWKPAVGLGWKWWAVVQPRNPHGAVLTSSFALTAVPRDHLTVRFFDSAAEAMTWLNEVG